MTKVRALPNQWAPSPEALDVVTDGVLAVDAEDRVVYANFAACELLGLAIDEALRRPLDEILRLETDRARHGPGSPQIKARRAPFHPTAKAMVLVSSCRRRSVEVVELNAEAPDQNGLRWTIIHDCSQEIELLRSIDQQARNDKLTGLLNRHEMDRCLAQMIEDAETNADTHALLYIDLDQFKVINDTCGHQAGDELLRTLGMRLSKSIQQGDLIGRIGGDEFAVLLYQVDKDEAMEVAERICHTVANTRFAWESYSFTVGASIGVTLITEHTRKASIAMQQVDTACYEAKERGRNRVHFYQETDKQLAKRRGEMLWISRINQALDNNQISIVCQAIESLNGEPAMAELLIRVRLPDGRQVLPGTFLPAAERYNLMPTLDRWMIRNALQAIANIDPKADRFDRYAINLSGISIGDCGFLDFILQEIERSKVSPKRLCFEITETAAVASYSRAVRFMSLLREIGCEFALDDFGSGMSSFGYLRELPVDYLKIDGSFITDLDIDPFHRAIVRSITKVNRAAGKKTIAEHVDSQKSIELLKSYGVDYVQGFFIDEPQPFYSPGNSNTATHN